MLRLVTGSKLLLHTSITATQFKLFNISPVVLKLTNQITHLSSNQETTIRLLLLGVTNSHYFSVFILILLVLHHHHHHH
jgi:hypothetical protein